MNNESANQLIKILQDHGSKAKLIPIRLLPEAKEEMQSLGKKVSLNNFQKYLLDNEFSYELPETDYEIRSLLIIATPSPTLRVYFNYQGKSLHYPIPSTYYDYDKVPGMVEGYLKEYLENGQLHMTFAHQLPRKYMAAKSGLAKYGRNNICYVEGLGSYINLACYFTDIACEDEGNYEVGTMEQCAVCRECLTHCPTKAILPDRFLIDNEICLTNMNEAGAEHEFPDWVSPEIHHALVGCTICQEVCPGNRKVTNRIIDSIEFSEEETELLMQGLKEETVPESLKAKVQEINMLWYLGALSRNLRVLLKRR